MVQAQQQLEFAYGVPNVCESLVVSNIEQRTAWNIKNNNKPRMLPKCNKIQHS